MKERRQVAGGRIGKGLGRLYCLPSFTAAPSHQSTTAGGLSLSSHPLEMSEWKRDRRHQACPLQALCQPCGMQSTPGGQAVYITNATNIWLAYLSGASPGLPVCIAMQSRPATRNPLPSSHARNNGGGDWNIGMQPLRHLLR